MAMYDVRPDILLVPSSEASRYEKDIDREEVVISFALQPRAAERSSLVFLICIYADPLDSPVALGKHLNSAGGWR